MTIEELLVSMQTKYKTNNGPGDSIRSLSNTKNTWQRIGDQDSFSELGFSSESEKQEWLSEWINSNPYNNI